MIAGGRVTKLALRREYARFAHIQKKTAGAAAAARRAALVISALLAAGCPASRSTSPDPAAPGDTGATAPLGQDVIVQASGRGPGENEAYAAAREALAEAVLGDAAWADLLDIEGHRRNVDPQRVTIVPGGATTSIGRSGAWSAPRGCARRAGRAPAAGRGGRR